MRFVRKLSNWKVPVPPKIIPDLNKHVNMNDCTKLTALSSLYSTHCTQCPAFSLLHAPYCPDSELVMTAFLEIELVEVVRMEVMLAKLLLLEG